MMIQMQCLMYVTCRYYQTHDMTDARCRWVIKASELVMSVKSIFYYSKTFIRNGTSGEITRVTCSTETERQGR